MTKIQQLPLFISLLFFQVLVLSSSAENSVCVNPVVNYGLPTDCVEETFTISLAIGETGSSAFYDIFYSVNDGPQVFWNSMIAGTTVGFGSFPFNTSVDVFVKDPLDPLCEVILNDLTIDGSSCCTSPTFSVTTVPNCSNGLFQGFFSLSSGTPASYQVYRSVEDGPSTFLGTYSSGSHSAGLFFLGQSVELTCISNDPTYCDETLLVTDTTVCNESCIDAIEIGCGEVVSGHTNGALPESPDPGLCGTSAGTGGAVWYSFTGSNSVFPLASDGLQGDIVTLSLCNDSSVTGGNSDFDTKIRVYKGTCDSLECVGGNDDSVGCSALSSIYSFPTVIGEQYFVLVHGYQSSEGLFFLSMDCESSGVCGTPTEFSANILVDGNAELSWIPTGNEIGWDVEYGFEGFQIGTGTRISNTSPNLYLSGLVADSLYEAYVRAICVDSLGTSSWTEEPVSFYSLPDLCSGLSFQDSGVDTTEYMNDEDFTYLLCPDNEGDTIAMEFTFVDIESTTLNNGTGCWDYLSIYNGIGFNDTIAATLCGQESGLGGIPFVASNLLSVGDRFQSTDPSGCLTVKFKSDLSIQRQGWSADVECIAGPCLAPSDLEVLEIGFGSNNPRVNAIWNNPESTTDCEVRGGRISGPTAGTTNPEFSNINNTQVISQTNGSTVNFNIVLFNNPSVPFVEGQTYGYEVRCYCEDEDGYSAWSGISPQSTFVVPFDSTGMTDPGEVKLLSGDSPMAVQIVPNPNDGRAFMLQFDRALETVTQAAILDMNGRVVYSESLGSGAERFMLSPHTSLSEGLYLIRLTSEQGVFQSRFIVQ